ncbi:hypothetical protein GQ53DRAFT_46955 [Thozetella sp. PMI_491]|nr:hypothetical protein GQ53DRAFT_93522 [Thozetella sp. PMI_491]KAH8879100.1 hypothetical protein GQ53DRAFT_46955 [Thozetella sp. PMI_491]
MADLVRGQGTSDACIHSMGATVASPPFPCLPLHPILESFIETGRVVLYSAPIKTGQSRAPKDCTSMESFGSSGRQRQEGLRRYS